MSCEVCNVEGKAWKYKCPKCRIHYCSLECWKSHKEQECSPPISQVSLNQDSTCEKISEYTFPTEDTVPVAALEKLESSEGVLECLRNPHLRDILIAIDKSSNPEAAMRAAMQEPIFTEFGEECLKVVQPKEDIKYLLSIDQQGLR